MTATLDQSDGVAAPTEELSERLTLQLETALDRHLAMAKNWYPHEYVPWDEGRDFTALPWDESQTELSPAVRTALQVNLLTEDNLPGYHGTLTRIYGDKDPWASWLDRWTAEEGRHSVVIRDYLTVTRAVDPVLLEQERMATVSAGFRAPDKDVLRAIAYVSIQELATRVSHRNTGLQSGDPGLNKLLGRVAADENLHMVLYRDLAGAAFEVAPTLMLKALLAEVVGFEMPGTGIPNFTRRSAAIARAGIYDLKVHRDDVLLPMFHHWQVFELEGLDAEGEQLREQLAAVVTELDRRVAKLQERAERAAARASA